MSEPQYTPGLFVWRELLTRDVPRAQAFYSELFGWSAEAMNMGDAGTYVVFSKGDKMVAGLMAMPTEVQAPPFWTSYVSVPSVDAAAAKAKELGGQVYVEPMDVPNIGRFATVADADGAVLGLYRSVDGDPAPAVPQVGQFCWETLVTKDVERAKTFYGAVAGWKAFNSMGMTTFGINETPEGMVADAQPVPNHPSHWATYVVVEKLEPSRDRAASLGANILEPLIEIPGVGRISFLQDPTGAAIGLYEAERK